MGEIVPMNEQARGIRALLTDPRTQAQIAAAMPSVGLTPQRFLRVAMTACTLNPDLYTCTVDSWKRALVHVAQLGLAPTGKGGVYLIPFVNSRKINGQWRKQKEVTVIPDYRGLLAVCRRSGQILRIAAAVVRDGDEIEWEHGRKPFLRHKERGGAPVQGQTKESDGGRRITHAYAIAHLRDAEEMPVFRVMERWEVDARRARSKAPNSPAWTNDYAAMARKTVLRALAEGGELPMQDDDQRLLTLMQAEDKGFDLGPSDDEPVQVDAEISDPEPTDPALDDDIAEIAADAAGRSAFKD